ELPVRFLDVEIACHADEALELLVPDGKRDLMHAVAAPERVVEVGIVERTVRRGRDGEDLGMLCSGLISGRCRSSNGSSRTCSPSRGTFCIALQSSQRQVSIHKVELN